MWQNGGKDKASKTMGTKEARHINKGYFKGHSQPSCQLEMSNR
jgi:hypothetical protein